VPTQFYIRDNDLQGLNRKTQQNTTCAGCTLFIIAT
jgi:hypothetical protein